MGGCDRAGTGAGECTRQQAYRQQTMSRPPTSRRPTVSTQRTASSPSSSPAPQCGAGGAGSTYRKLLPVIGRAAKAAKAAWAAARFLKRSGASRARAASSSDDKVAWRRERRVAGSAPEGSTKPHRDYLCKSSCRINHPFECIVCSYKFSLKPQPLAGGCGTQHFYPAKEDRQNVGNEYSGHTARCKDS